MSRARFQEYPILVPAGQEKYFAITGTAIHAYELNGILKIAFDSDGQKTVFAQGLQYPEQPFKGFHLINKSAADIEGIVLIGQGTLKDSRLSLAGVLSIQNEAGGVLNTKPIRASALTSKSPVTVVNGAAKAQIIAANAARMSVTIRNLHVAYTVWIGGVGTDAPSAKGFPLAPGEAIRFNVEDGAPADFYAHNNSGSDISISILEAVE